MGVIRLSPAAVKAGPEESERIVRNLYGQKSTPPRPTRRWRKKTGPGDEHLTTTATAIIRGASMMSAVAATVRSTARLLKSFIVMMAPRLTPDISARYP